MDHSLSLVYMNTHEDFFVFLKVFTQRNPLQHEWCIYSDELSVTFESSGYSKRDANIGFSIYGNDGELYFGEFC